MSALLRLVLFALLVLCPASALASRTVAVLPLTKASGSETYDGLGIALAGMLVADLSGVESLQLVERERLDALIDELSLSETGFLDPATAQRLGQGVGAELVLTGSYSVVGSTFLMDTRLVEVETSHVLDAATGDGPLDDFVAVEKDVVVALLEQLAVTLGSGDRRRLLLETPTESFEAFASYGLGMAREGEGKLEEAKVAFEAAVKVDPEFAEAQAALVRLKSQVQGLRADDVASALTDRERRLHAVLAGTVDERERPKKYRYSDDDLALLGLRLYALERLQLHCQRYAEFTAYLERVGWKGELPAAWNKPYVMVRLVSEHAWALGLVDKSRPDEDYIHETSIAGAASLLSNPERAVLEFDANDPEFPQSESLVHSMFRCVDSGGWIAEIEAITDKVERAGLADETYDTTYPAVRFADKIGLVQLRLEVRRGGMTPAREARTQALLDTYQDLEGARGWALRAVELLVAEGEGYQSHQARRMGLSEAELLGIARAVVDADPDLLDTSTEICQVGTDHARRLLAGSVERYAEDRWGPRHLYTPWTLSSIGSSVAPLAVLGCLEGIPPRFATPEEAWTHVAEARSRAIPERADHDDCASAWTSIDGMRPLGDTPPNPMLTYSMVSIYFTSAVGMRCVSEPPLR